MGLYERWILPKLIDSACRQPPMMALRQQFVPKAQGRVLEIGIGSGHNLPFYKNAESVTGLEPNPALMERARGKAQGLSLPVRFLSGSAEAIPTDQHSFDTVVSTWTLCSVADVPRALSEIRRVLKPDGQFVFIEHGLAPDEGVQVWQRRLNPVWRRIGGGCHLDRNVPRLLERAGFRVADLAASYSPGPRFAAFMYRGIASA